MKCLEIARLQYFAPNTQGLLRALSGPQTPCRIELTPSENFCLRAWTGTSKDYIIVNTPQPYAVRTNIGALQYTLLKPFCQCYQTKFRQRIS